MAAKVLKDWAKRLFLLKQVQSPDDCVETNEEQQLPPDTLIENYFV